MEPFYAAQFTSRQYRLVSEFARSPELAAALPGDVPCYLPPFLQMMYDLSADLTDPDDAVYFSGDLELEIIADVPVWSQTADLAEAPRMATELLAFFRFADRTNTVPVAAEWVELLERHDVAAIFEGTMRFDRRIRRPKPPARRDPRDGMRRKKRKRARRRQRGGAMMRTVSRRNW
jgi:hypothetical protein